MKLIDHTPYLNEKGELSPWHKILGMMRFGDFWVDEIKAQKAIIEELDRSLAPGYTLLRNIQLPGSKVLFPLVLVGPAGIFMMTVTTMKGRYHAIEGSWQVESKGATKPARPNLLNETSKMAKAIQNYLERFGVKKGLVEGVLIAANLSMYIEKINPIVRIVMRDTVSLFTDDLNKAEGVLDSSSASRIADVLAENLPAPQAELEIPLREGFEDLLQTDESPDFKMVPEKPEPVETQPLKFGDDSTPWNLMEDFSFDPGEDEELPLADIPQEQPVKPILEKTSTPTTKKTSRSRFTIVQWIVLAAAAVVVIYLLAFIFRTLGNIL
jgi:hypothetical protein